MPAKPQRLPARRASLTVELLLLAPVLIVLAYSVIELSLLVAALNKVEAAGALGARVAAQGGNEASVHAEIKQFLGDNWFQHASITPGADATVLASLPSGALVEVGVSIPASKVLPGPIGLIGLTVGKDKLTAQTAQRKE